MRPFSRSNTRLQRPQLQILYKIIYFGVVLFDTVLGGSKCSNEDQVVSDFRKKNLDSIPGNIRPNTTWLDLGQNKITTVPNNSLQALLKLQRLDLSYNAIDVLQKRALFGLQKLCHLDLSGNPLSNLSFPEDTFIFTPNLEVLYFLEVDGNFPDKAFRNLVNLSQLYVSPPNGFFLGPGFADMHNLREFHITGGYVNALKNDSFAPLRYLGLKKLICRHCGLEEIETGVFVNLTNLVTLELSHNIKLGLPNAMRALYGLQHTNMGDIIFEGTNSVGTFSKYDDFVLGEEEAKYLKTICVESLDLGWNYIIYVTSEFVSSLEFPKCIVRLSLRRHSIQTLSTGLFDMLTFVNLQYLDISGSMHPTLSAFTENVEGYLVRVNPQVSDVESDILTTQATGSLSIPFPPNITYFDASRTISQWLWPSDTLITNTGKLEFVDLSFNGFSNCVVIVANTDEVRVLNMSGIDCSTFSPNTFEKFPNLEYLEMSGVNLGRGIHSDSGGILFEHQTQLSSLNLADNGLSSLHDNLFRNLKQLKTLSLANNKFMSIPATVRHTESLSHLDLSYNSLTHLRTSETLWLVKLSAQSDISVHLQGNPLSCSCSTVEFLQWLIETEVDIIYEREALTCTFTNGTLVQIVSLTKDLTDFQIQCLSRFWLVFSVTSASLVCAVLMISVVCYRYRYNIKYWFLTKCKSRATYETVEEDFQFDAFVAYNHNDYHWVCFTLREFLEDRNNYRLCLHHRDFLVGESIQQNIVDAINSSRKIILVVSQRFLSSDWSEFEIRMAGMRMVQEGRENVVVVVLLEDIPMRQMPRSLVSMWKNVTFLLWTDDPPDADLFWERLNNAMVRT